MHLTIILIPYSLISSKLHSETIIMRFSAISTQIISLCTFLVCCCCCYCFAAKENITTGETINDGLDYLESPGKKFQMGFFPLEKTTEHKRYVGIWYSMDPKVVVWVANRDNPVRDSSGVLTISQKDGKAKLLDGTQTEHFSTNKGLQAGNSLRALKLLDSGNAILIDVVSGSILWQSFDIPTNTFLPGMKMVENLNLTSWKSEHDPASGSFIFQQDADANRYTILNELTPFWKSKINSMNSFDENQNFSEVIFNLLSNTTTQKLSEIVKQNGNINFVNTTDEVRLVMSYTGGIQYYRWTQDKKEWVMVWKEPKDNCSVFKVCGLFGMCSLDKDPLCSCLPEFEPVSPDHYKVGDYKDGCKKKFDTCDRVKDTFRNTTMISIDNTPLPFIKLENESACINECLQNCSCVAYSYGYQNKIRTLNKSLNWTHGCWFWDSGPNNLRGGGRHNISFRVSYRLKDAVQKPASMKLVLAVIIVLSAMVLSFLCGIIYISYKRFVNKRENNLRNIEIESNNMWTRINELLDLDHSKDDKEGIDVPYFDLESIIAATDDFSEKNRLGQGGFGPVYKGKLPGGQEVAVKRLSSLSGQGLQEFKNEVMLIAKLQHRNLVRLLGYCIMGEEKMLLYEYMPNRSLDTFIFDRKLCTSLEWEKRFNIIMGIARGLNYLHHDSRLRVIHRDLKTSNILLDEDMNPKISDFGLAKIVKGKDMEAITNRVIGTFGYMSPEYALDGLFSIKSDVFSFGVVMLEIVSGKRNTGFYQSQRSLSILRHAWNLLREDRPFELMDEILMESSNSSEVLKCIIIGLLCVQGDPNDRPNMTNVLLMLAGDIITLPTPKEPAFVPRMEHAISSSFSSSKTDTQSKNMLTITKLDGR